MNTGERRVVMCQLKGRKAIITGGSTGIGKEIAILYAKEGADVAVTYFTGREETEKFANELAKKYHTNVIAEFVDVSNEENVKNMVNNVLKIFGTIDILVCSAGILQRKDVEQITLEDWNKMISTNLTGTFLCCKNVLPIMEENHYGRIINIASQIGQKGAAQLAHYAASKGGIIAYTKSLARAVGKKGITANCIAPGPIMTSMTTDNFSDTLEEDKKALPIGRQGEAAEVAPTALLLAGDVSGALYTGQTLGPNSGDVML